MSEIKSSENIILQGENQNMTVEELHQLLIKDCEPLIELRAKYGDEKAGEMITERREIARSAIRRMLVSVQACSITLNNITDENDAKMRKALDEYEKKYKPKLQPQAGIRGQTVKAEKLTKTEKTIKDLIKKFGFSQVEAEKIVMRRMK